MSSVRVPLPWPNLFTTVARRQQQLVFLESFTVGARLNADAPGNARQGKRFLTALVHDNPAGSSLLLFFFITSCNLSASCRLLSLDMAKCNPSVQQGRNVAPR